MKAHPRGSDVLWCLGQTAARRSLSGNRILRASEVPGCKSVEYEEDTTRKKVTEEQPFSLKLKFRDTKTHVKALFCGKELGHGAKRNSIRSVLLQRRGSLAHQQARRHQTGGHFSQFELKILQTGEKLTVRPVVKSAFISLKGGGGQCHSPGCWRASLQTAYAPTGDLLLAVRRRVLLRENRMLRAE